MSVKMNVTEFLKNGQDAIVAFDWTCPYCSEQNYEYLLMEGLDYAQEFSMNCECGICRKETETVCEFGVFPPQLFHDLS